MAAWVSGRLGISHWAASRWVNAAKALEKLPKVSEAFTAGVLSVDKVVELTRHATPDTETELIKWAKNVNPATIRRRADVANRASTEDHQDAYNARHFYYWYDDHMLRFEGALPAEAGAKFIKAVNRIADTLPRAPKGSEDDIDCSIDARRADALVALAQTRIAQDQDPDRATVVVHVDIDSLRGEGSLGAAIESGGVIHPEIARRLSCCGNIEWVLEDGERHAVGIGMKSRQVPKWMERQLRYRDRCCTFPGCGRTRFVQAHHIDPWPSPTDLNNLVLLCDFHQNRVSSDSIDICIDRRNPISKLVHEFQWKVALTPTSKTEWFRPDGRRYEAGLRGKDRAPPDVRV
jgi:hypothetical protein